MLAAGAGQFIPSVTVALGAVLNAVVLPPLHGGHLEGATRRLASTIGDVLKETAALVRGGEPPRSGRSPERAHARCPESCPEAEDAIGRTQGSRYLNLRRRGKAREEPLADLVSLWPPLALSDVLEPARAAL